MRRLSGELVRTGFLNSPCFAAAARAYQLDHVYIPLKNKMKIILEVHKHVGKADTSALIDSSATENFIDHREVIRLRLRTKKLLKPLIGYNIDDTPNKHGKITDYVELLIQQGNHKKRMRFLVSNLGISCMVLGYPFLHEFNPNLDWKLGKILGSRLRVYTINRAIGLDMFKCQIDRAVSQLEEGEELHYRINRMTMATEMAIKDYDPTKVNTAETIPK